MREKNFSERMGIVEVSIVLQHDSMNQDLRNSLWNVLYKYIWDADGFMYDNSSSFGDIIDFSYMLWVNYLKRPIDMRPKYPSEILQEIRTYFFNASWNKVYEFVEYVLITSKGRGCVAMRSDINNILEQELSGFRLIKDKFVPITNKNEIEEISAVLDSPYAGCQNHLRKALEHMSNRENPDYRNSIKESISAIESIANEITGNTGATLNNALAKIEKNGEIHAALKKGFVSLYGYTSDADGIRHGMVDNNTNLTVADAKYFLVTCSAFINYLIAKHADTT